ncbi:YdcF family protein [Brucella endophytica]|uniref:YdcF family protein n=1 Tax=Brucella endophytica TaxID=1963359 RepID=UPI001AEDFFDA|nr:YdcF family protein [Brucella endophytica]
MAFGLRRAAGTLLGLTLALFLAIGCGPVPSFLLTRLQAPFVTPSPVEWRQRNVIVLLGGGAEKVADTQRVEPQFFAYTRIVKAVSLYNECRKTATDCKILVTGGDASKTGESEAAVYSGLLTQLGVAASDVIEEAKSMNTWQNAEFSSRLLENLKPDRIVLVTSGIHMRRSELYFSHFGVDATPERADYTSAILSPLPLAYNFALMDFALHEYTGIARFRLYNALGWNPARSRPGQA